MNREEVEATIRGQLAHVVTCAIRVGRPPTEAMNRATDTILRAAGMYRPALEPDPQAPRHRADLYAEVWGGGI